MFKPLHSPRIHIYIVSRTLDPIILQSLPLIHSIVSYIPLFSGTPHVDTSGNVISGNFEPTGKIISMKSVNFLYSFIHSLTQLLFIAEYGMSVAVVPIVIMAIGLFAIIFFQLILLSRCLFTCSKCAPNEKDIDSKVGCVLLLY